MADLTVTASQFRPMEVIEARLIPMIAAEAITKGQAVYQNTSGNAALSNAGASGTVATLVGIATSTVPAGAAVDVLHYGRLAGMGVSGLNAGAAVYASNTAGALADAAGTVSKIVGRVFCMNDRARTKFLFVDVRFNV